MGCSEELLKLSQRECQESWAVGAQICANEIGALGRKIIGLDYVMCRVYKEKPIKRKEYSRKESTRM